MSSPTTGPHLVSLVLQSKKALQHGEQLCTDAQTMSYTSAQYAVDVLALDAKVRWINTGVISQLELAKTIAESIEEKRRSLGERVQEWDAWRVRHTDALDAALDSLGRQVVPPNFHQSSSDSSLFGSQHSQDGNQDEGQQRQHPSSNHRPEPSSSPFHASPTATLREEPRAVQTTDRSRWKTLRDFVDDRAIEDAQETIETDRAALGDLLSGTEDYPETLSATIAHILSAIPPVTVIPLSDPSSSQSSPPSAIPSAQLDLEQILNSQDALLTSMAHKLESLAAHYDQMAGALRESETEMGDGEGFSEEDLQDMNRDTDELPSIMGEMEESTASIQGMQNQLLHAKTQAQEHLDLHHGILADLDELALIMEEMIDRQDTVEAECTARLSTLSDSLNTLSHLHDQFVAYEKAFSRLLLELARRRRYGEAIRGVAMGMQRELDGMVEEERQLRDQFTAEHGAYLPDDLCLSVGNAPTTWSVSIGSGGENDDDDVVPVVDGDLLDAAISRLRRGE